MQYIEAPALHEPHCPVTLFLGGGITNCPDWQSVVVDMLRGYPITIYNPRRKEFPHDNPHAKNEQGTWEYYRLIRADINAFWFPKETDAPLALLEYGESLVRGDVIILGMDPLYKRREDVELRWVLNKFMMDDVVYTLEEFVEHIIATFNIFKKERAA